MGRGQLGNHTSSVEGEVALAVPKDDMTTGQIDQHAMKVEQPMPTNSPSLTQQSSRGALWSLSGNVVVSGISFIGTAILARILEPKDFGLIGMATLATGVISLFGNFGLGGALVHKKEPTHEDLCTVFWANLIAGLVLTLLCILLSPLVAAFFGERLVKWILILLAANFTVSAVSSVHNTLMYKRLQMKQMAVRDILGRVLRVGIMLIAAFWGFAVWSIVCGMIAERIFRSVSFYRLEPWRPSCLFSVQRFRDMFGYGRNILGSGILNYLNQNMDFIVTGRILGANLLGFYQMAFNIPYLVRGYVNDSLVPVLFPAFCRVQDDSERLSKGLLKVVTVISLGIFPIAVGLAFVATDFVLVVYGDKWIPAVTALQVLCFGAALASVNSVIRPLLNAIGRPDLNLKWGLVCLPVTILAILVGAHFGDIVGVAWGMIVVEVLYLAMAIHTLRLLRRNSNNYWRALLPATVGCVIMVSVLAILNQLPLMKHLPPFVRLVLDFLLGSGIYVILVIIVFREAFNEFIDLMKQTAIISKIQKT